MDRKAPGQLGKRMQARMARQAKRWVSRPPEDIDTEDISDEKFAELQEWADSADHTPAYLSVLEDWFNEGDIHFLADAIATCAETGRPLPDWAANAYLQGHGRVRSNQASSWDEILGKPIGKGKRAARARRRKEISEAFFERAREILVTEDLAIDAEFFERLGKEFNMSGSAAKQLYYSIKRFRPF